MRCAWARGCALAAAHRLSMSKLTVASCRPSAPAATDPSAASANSPHMALSPMGSSSSSRSSSARTSRAAPPPSWPPPASVVHQWETGSECMCERMRSRKGVALTIRERSCIPKKIAYHLARPCAAGGRLARLQRRRRPQLWAPRSRRWRRTWRGCRSRRQGALWRGPCEPAPPV